MEKSEIHFWTQLVWIGGSDYDLTMATTSQGLCWLGLGRALEEEEALVVWAKRWFPDQELIRQRQVNAKLIEEIEEYLSSKRQEFTVSLHQKGTPFQIRVWQELSRIPYGVTCSYADIAEKIGCPKGPRAIGLANNKNPIALVVPCHRVIGKNGNLTGYGGGVDLKLKLLKLEGAKNVSH
ncbi:MAG: methylated-DNA--[protein]-cysteine S-methyltransferase [Desulfitobacteriaceae bacterium]